MQTTINLFMRWPGGENEGGGSEPAKEDTSLNPQPGTGEPQPEKGFIAKIKDALQDWSNEDQQEQDLDDATP